MLTADQTEQAEQPEPMGTSSAVAPDAGPAASGRPRSVVVAGAVAAGGLTALALVHRYVSGLPPTVASRLSPLDALFSLALLATLLSLAWAIGRRVTRALAVPWQSAVEEALFSVGIGLALVAYTALAVSWVRLLYAQTLLVAGAVAIVLLREELAWQWTQLQQGVRSLRTWRGKDSLATIVALFAVACLLIAVVNALLPPFTYDVLWYHLAVPQTFVEQHRFVVLPYLAQANFPFTIEMLYTVCLAFADDRTPALLHLAFGVLATLAIWSFAGRWFGRRVAWLAVAGFITASEVQRWALVANIDLALTLYELLALYAVIAWREARNPRWLLLAGVMVGVAMASKYTAIMALLPLGLLVLVADGPRPADLLRAGRWCAAFGLVAVAVAAPWYVKNALVLHDPVYPLLTGERLDPSLHVPVSPPAASGEQPLLLRLVDTPLHLVMTQPEMALTGRGLGDYLLLPLTVYQRGDLESHTQPSILYVLAPFCVFLLARPVVRRLALAGAILCLLWALGPQQLRYLLPTFPVLSLLSAVVLAAIAGRLRQPRAARLALLLPVAALLALTLATDLAVAAALRPWPVVLGLESRDTFLRGAGVDFGAFAYLEETMRPGERALALGERRGYYVQVPIILDNTSTLGTIVFSDPGSPERTVAFLRTAHVDYILVYAPDLAWLAQFHPASVHQERTAFERFRESYLQEVYHDQEGQVYRLKQGGAN